MNRDDVPARYRGLYDRALRGAASPRRAIRLHCIMCMGWQAQDVEHCTATSCPLYRYRMGSRAAWSRADTSGATGAEATSVSDAPSNGETTRRQRHRVVHESLPDDSARETQRGHAAFIATSDAIGTDL